MGLLRAFTSQQTDRDSCNSLLFLKTQAIVYFDDLFLVQILKKLPSLYNTIDFDPDTDAIVDTAILPGANLKGHVLLNN